MNTIKKIAIALAVLMVFSLAAPATADYSSDNPLVTYAKGPLNNGGIVYETVEDGSGYTKLYCTYYPWDQGFGESSDKWCNWTQTIQITGIPAGATVKTARLYNYVSWSTSDNDNSYVSGAPAEADMWFTNPAGATQKKVCKHGMPDYTGLANPINYNNGVMQYWDTKGPNYACGIKYDFPSGTFAWDVTDMVTGNGIYTAKITNNDTTPTGVRPGEDPFTSVKRERFVTYGFGLLVVYEEDDKKGKKAKMAYWIDEGCDLLLNTSKYGVYESIATTNAPFDATGLKGKKKATLTAVVVTCDKGNAMDWSASYNMNYFNGLTPKNQIGPSTAANYKAIGVNSYDVKLKKKLNIAYFQDRDLGTGRGDNEVVSNAFLITEGKK